MSAQNVKENMSKGEWIVNNTTITANNKSRNIATVNSAFFAKLESNANAEAICTSVNGTYGNNIDPSKLKQSA